MYKQYRKDYSVKEILYNNKIRYRGENVFRKYGYRAEKIIQYENVSEQLRNRVWNLFYQTEIKDIYQSGEEAESQIKLNSITKNSPVLLAFTVVGVMGGVMGYLAYRNHKVDTVVDSTKIFDIPSDRKEALKNVIKNEDNNMLNDDTNNTKVDNKILGLAVDTYGKLEGVTEKKKVKVEYNKKD